MSARPQLGITAEGNSSALFLTYNQSGEDGALANVLAVLQKIPQWEAEYRDLYPEAAFHAVAAIGSGYWGRVSPQHQPAELEPFPAMENGDNVAPFTPADLLFHIRSERKDLNFQFAARISEQLGQAAELIEEIEGFRYLDNRDLTGFVDGTENPEGEQRLNVAVVGDEDPGFYGGSYIHLQRYVHNLPVWNRLQVKAQEDIVGRTKAENVEYAGADKALTAHTKRTSLKDEQGRSIEILRHSMPYGDTQEAGLMFASYCRSSANFRIMLESMVHGDGHGHTDHLLKYTRAVTGNAFFAPSVEMLSGLGQ